MNQCTLEEWNELCKDFGAPNPDQDGLTREMFDEILFTIDFNKATWTWNGFDFYYTFNEVSLFEILAKLDSHKGATEKIHKYFDQDKDGFLNMKEVEKLLQIKITKQDFDFELDDEKWKELCAKMGVKSVTKGWNVCDLEAFYIDERIDVFEMVQIVKKMS